MQPLGSARSIPEVVDELVEEFGCAFSVRAVTDVAMRLSADGAMTLPVLADAARLELAGMLSDDRTR